MGAARQDHWDRPSVSCVGANRETPEHVHATHTEHWFSVQVEQEELPRRKCVTVRTVRLRTVNDTHKVKGCESRGSWEDGHIR